MPTFGDFETYGEPLAVTEEPGHVSTVWQARKAGAGNVLYIVKCYAPRSANRTPGEGLLEKDRGLQFLDGIKQIKKAQTDKTGRYLAPIHDLGRSESEAWYATDHYPRNNLKTWIARRGGVDSVGLRHVLQSVVAGCLALKRSRGYSHGNLKPSNVFLVGQPRPLKKTPLVLTDAYPAAPQQLAGLDAGDRAEVGDLLSKVVEAEDLRKIGELILQLIEGRLFSRSDDYNYPVPKSSIWDILGKDADFWLNKCNTLVNPQLSIESTNLEALAKEFGSPMAGLPELSKGLAKKAGLAVGVAGAVCAMGAVVYVVSHSLSNRAKERENAVAEWKTHFDRAEQLMDQVNFHEADGEFAAAAQGLAKWRGSESDKFNQTETGRKAAASLAKASELLAARQTSDALTELETTVAAKPGYSKALEWVTSQALPQATNAAATTNFSDAGRWVALAAKATPESSAAKSTGAWVEQQQTEENFRSARQAAQLAYDRHDFSTALTQADKALLIHSTDPGLTTLRANAKNALDSQAAAGNLESQYRALTNAAWSYYARKDYTNAMAQADQALAIHSEDESTRKLKAEAQRAWSEALAGLRLEGRFRSLTNSAWSAFAGKDYTNAISQADAALAIHPDDSVARKLKADAQAARNAVLAGMRVEDQYRSYTNDAWAALGRKDYTNAALLADQALSIHSDDAVTKKLKSDAQSAWNDTLAAMRREDQYKALTNAAWADFRQKDYSNAMNQADAALAIHANDPVTRKLQSDAQAAWSDTEAVMQREDQYRALTNAAWADYANKDYTNAVTQADKALAIHSADQNTKTLRADAQSAWNDVQAAMQREDQYKSLTNAAWASYNQKDYNNAVKQAAQALKIHADDSAMSKLSNNAQQAIASAMEDQDRKTATDYFNSGRYAEAAAICQKHTANPQFQDLLTQVAAEQNSYTKASSNLNAGNYAFISEVKAQSYSGKSNFATLLDQGTKEATSLAGLRQLRETNDWQDVQARFADPGVAALATKPPFGEIQRWAQDQAKAQEAAKAEKTKELDAQFARLLKALNVSPPRALNMEPAKDVAKETQGMGGALQDSYRKKVNDLEQEYTRLKLIDDNFRATKYFKTMRDRIINLGF